jgi:hypothetical protein
LIVKEYGEYGKKGIRKAFSAIRREISNYNKESLDMVQRIMDIHMIANLVGLSLCETCKTYCLSREVCINEKL